MSEFAFVGEIRREPPVARDDAYRLVKNCVAMLAGIGGLGAAIYGIFLGYIVTPFYYYDAMAMIGVAIGSLVLVLTGLRLLASGMRGQSSSSAFSVVSSSSASQRRETTSFCSIKNSIIPWPSHRRFASRTCGYDRADMGSAQPVRLAQREWRDLVPGTSMLLLRVHSGRFGFAWYEPNPPAVVR